MTEFMFDAREGLNKRQQRYCKAIFGEIPPHATVYNGRKMNIAWAAILADAQNTTERFIDDEVLPRIRFGSEPLASSDSHCPDCFAAKHTFHWPGCPIEVCMACRKSGTDCKCKIGYFDGSV